MKKILLFIGIAAMAIGTFSCGNKEKLEEEENQVADLTQQYQQATSFNDSLMLLMGDIYTGLDSINSQEQLLYAPGQGDNVNRREEIKQNLTAIKARLNANRQLIAQLEAKAKASGKDNAVLNKTITQLKQHIDSQEKKIADLEQALADANKQIGTLTEQVAQTEEQVRTETAAKEQAQAQVEETTNELNTVYYAIGTNKELKQQGLLEKKFLGATKVMKGEYNSSYFTKADKRNLSEIATSGKKVKIWTNMPSGSYQIVDNANGTQTVKITNPTQFWSITPYLIIQIDK